MVEGLEEGLVGVFDWAVDEALRAPDVAFRHGWVISCLCLCLRVSMFFPVALIEEDVDAVLVMLMPWHAARSVYRYDGTSQVTRFFSFDRKWILR